MGGTLKGGHCCAQVKCLMAQLLNGMAHLHENWVLHRDLKTSNILISNTGKLKAGMRPCTFDEDFAVFDMA